MSLPPDQAITQALPQGRGEIVVARQAMDRGAQRFQCLAHPFVGVRFVADQIAGHEDEIHHGVPLPDARQHRAQPSVHVHAPDPAAGLGFQVQVGDLQDSQRSGGNGHGGVLGNDNAEQFTRF
jgi:hypothetical protein